MINVRNSEKGDIANHSLDNFFRESHIELHQLQRQGILCDVKICGREQCDVIPVHRCVLACKSSYFRAMFTSSMLEATKEVIVLENLHDSIVKKLIMWCYTGHIEVSSVDIEDILDGAHMLGLDRVANKCFSYLHNNMDTSNCYGIVYLAEKYSCPTMHQIAERFAVNNFRVLANSEDFAEIKYEHLVSLLSQNHLNVMNECEVYEAVIRWVKYNVEERRSHLNQLLMCVRFPMLGRKYLMDHVAQEELIINHPECRKYLYSALDYHLLPERRTNKVKKSEDVEDGSYYSARRNLTNAIYVIGGENESGVVASVEMFCMGNRSWEETTSLPSPRKHVSVAFLGGNIYCVGGVDADGCDLDDVDIFDPVSQSWSSAASLNLCKGALSVVVIDGWLYAAGGSQRTSALKHVERFDSTRNQWCAVPDMKYPRSHFGTACVDDKLYAIGGHNGICEIEHCEMFDPVSNKWTDTAHLNKPRKHHAVCTHAQKLFAVGGVCQSRILDCIEKYNKGLEMWLIIKHTLDPRAGACVLQVKSDSAYNSSKDVEQNRYYWETTKCLSNANPLEGEEEEHLLYVMGGIGGLNGYQNDVKVLDLKSVDYSITGGTALRYPRAYCGSVAL